MNIYIYIHVYLSIQTYIFFMYIIYATATADKHRKGLETEIEELKKQLEKEFENHQVKVLPLDSQIAGMYIYIYIYIIHACITIKTPFYQSITYCYFLKLSLMNKKIFDLSKNLALVDFALRNVRPKARVHICMKYTYTLSMVYICASVFHIYKSKFFICMVYTEAYQSYRAAWLFVRTTRCWWNPAKEMYGLYLGVTYIWNTLENMRKCISYIWI